MEVPKRVTGVGPLPRSTPRLLALLLAAGALSTGPASAADHTREFLQALGRVFRGEAPLTDLGLWGQAFGLVALLVGTVALLAAVWTRYRNRAYQRDFEQLQAEHGHSLGPCDSSRLLQRGRLLLIEPLTGDRAQTFEIRLEGADAKTLALREPETDNGQFDPGKRLAVSLQQGRYSYRFETEVLRRLPGPKPLLLLRRPNSVERFERREFFRITTYLPCRFRLDPLTQSLSEPAGPPQPFTQAGVITNLSASGFRLVSETRVLGRALLTVSFALDTKQGREQIVARAEPLTCDPAEEGGYEIRARFADIGRAQRERIVSYVLERERAAIRKQADSQDAT